MYKNKEGKIDIKIPGYGIKNYISLLHQNNWLPKSQKWIFPPENIKDPKRKLSFEGDIWQIGFLMYALLFGYIPKIPSHYKSIKRGKKPMEIIV